MEKCTFCVHRVEEGRLPACVETCPVTALRFGDIDDDESPVSQFIREHQTWHLLEETGTKPSVFFVGGKPPTHSYKEIERPKGSV
jgi:Fe-S-cluster-containing dehydrogenase component